MFDSIKIRSAMMHHQKGDLQRAKQEYEAFYQKGLIRCLYILPWATLLLREGGEENYKKVREILAKAQKAPDITPQNRNELLLDFAVADWKLGNREAAISLMERVHQKAPTGNSYGALGYLYVEMGDAEKALSFNQQALEYDDEDAVILDNMGQAYYRLMNDHEKALEYFKKAHEIKPSQIDTLWFLSRYDLEKGDREAAIEKLETAVSGRFSPLNYKTKTEIEAELSALRG